MLDLLNTVNDLMWGYCLIAALVGCGLFSNEAGEGSAPNAAATAAVSHPVKQGLIQALGVFTDTLLGVNRHCLIRA